MGPLGEEFVRLCPQGGLVGTGQRTRVCYPEAVTLPAKELTQRADFGWPGRGPAPALSAQGRPMAPSAPGDLLQAAIRRRHDARPCWVGSWIWAPLQELNMACGVT